VNLIQRRDHFCLLPVHSVLEATGTIFPRLKFIPTLFDYCAMHRLPDKARANHLNPGLMTHTGFIHGRYASQRMGLVATSPILHKQ